MNSKEQRYWGMPSVDWDGLGVGLFFLVAVVLPVAYLVLPIAMALLGIDLPAWFDTSGGAAPSEPEVGYRSGP